MSADCPIGPEMSARGWSPCCAVRRRYRRRGVAGAGRRGDSKGCGAVKGNAIHRGQFDGNECYRRRHRNIIRNSADGAAAQRAPIPSCQLSPSPPPASCSLALARPSPAQSTAQPSPPYFTTLFPYKRAAPPPCLPLGSPRAPRPAPRALPRSLGSPPPPRISIWTRERVERPPVAWGAGRASERATEREEPREGGGIWDFEQTLQTPTIGSFFFTPIPFIALSSK